MSEHSRVLLPLEIRLGCKDNFSTRSGTRTEVYIVLQLYFICEIVSIENVETTTLMLATNRTEEVCPKKTWHGNKNVVASLPL